MDVETKYADPVVLAFWKEFSRCGLQQAERQMLERYAPSPPAEVLDLGCGGGRVALALSSRGYRVTGVDISAPMIAMARSLLEEQGIEPLLIRADLRTLPLPAASFDLALVFVAALQHIQGREQRRTVFREIARVLRPDGCFILGLDNVAPALRCYLWWANRRRQRLLSGEQSQPERVAQTAADEFLALNRRGLPDWRIHLRGIHESLRWRTWMGASDLFRRMRWRSGEPGDTWVTQVSLRSTPGRVFYHLYRHEELAQDAAETGLRLVAYHSTGELAEGVNYPERIRRLEKQVFYLFRLAAVSRSSARIDYIQ